MKITEDGGSVRVFGKDGGGKAGMGITEYGGSVLVLGKDGGGSAGMIIDGNGGSVSVLGKGNTDMRMRALMGVNQYGNGAINTWDKNGYRLATLK